MPDKKPTVQKIIPPATVLVTGGTGFVGSYVIRDLAAAGYRIRSLRRTPSLPFFIDAQVLRGVEWIDTDILDPDGLSEALEGADAIIHCAARVSFDPRDRSELFDTNIEGTANVVNAAIESGIRKFIYVSSVAALGKKNDGSLVNETAKWINSKHQTNYAISKNLGEMEVWRGVAEGLDALIINPSTILGFGDWNNSSCALFKNVYKGFPWYTNGVNGFVSVEDVSAVIVKLLSTPVSAERFIVNGENRPYRDILNMIADGFGTKRPSREATPLLAAIAWRVEKLKSIFGGRMRVTSESAKVARSNTRYDNSKILHTLEGFSFTSLEETIQDACERYMASVQEMR